MCSPWQKQGKGLNLNLSFSAQGGDEQAVAI
jgi:hypothetical protein